VDKIEILRGNASALYGPGAAGGVIQIFTKNSLNTGPYGSMSYGSRNTQNYLFGYGGKFNDTTFNASFNHQQSNGFPSMNPKQNNIDVNGNNIANPANSPYFANSFSVNISQLIGPGHEIGLSILGSEISSTIDANFNDSNPTAYDYLQKQDSKTVLSQIYLKEAITSYWNSNLTLSASNVVTRNNHNSIDYDNGTNNISGEPIGYFTTHQNNLSSINDFIITPNQTVLLGIQTQQTNIYTSDIYFGQNPLQAERTLNSIFSGYTGKFNALGIQLNGRYDRTNTRQSATTGLAGISYELTSHFKITGNISNAFILPTPYQLYSGAAMGGNRNLVPEYDNSQEISFQYADKDTLFRAVMFNRDTKNLIAAGSTYASTCSQVEGPDYCSFAQLENISKAKTDGIELSAKKNFDRIMLKASATFQDPRNETNNSQLIRRSKKFGNVEMNYSIQKYTIGGQIFMTGPTTDILVLSICEPSSPCVKNSGYSIVNLFASYKYDDNWSTKVRVENLFNKSYETAYGYNTPGLGAFLTLQYSPGTSKETK
jgi:vitamin B12 transporter